MKAKEMALDAVRLRQIINYDPYTGMFTWAKRVGRGLKGMPAGTLANTGYIHIMVSRCGYQAHRLAWLHTTGRWPPEDIDHINGIKTDNRLSNLRECSRGQNQCNMGRKSNNTSGFKGVNRRSDRSNSARPWISCIRVKGRRIHLGRFATAQEAHAVYAAAAIKYFGEFACP